MTGDTDRDYVYEERMRLHELMWQHVLTLPLEERGVWVEPMSVVRHGRFLTADEKLANLARGLDMSVPELVAALRRTGTDAVPEVPFAAGEW